MGQINHGHYISMKRKDNKWILYNDHQIKILNDDSNETKTLQKKLYMFI